MRNCSSSWDFRFISSCLSAIEYTTAGVVVPDKPAGKPSAKRLAAISQSPAVHYTGRRCTAGCSLSGRMAILRQKSACSRHSPPALSCAAIPHRKPCRPGKTCLHSRKFSQSGGWKNQDRGHTELRRNSRIPSFSMRSPDTLSRFFLQCLKPSISNFQPVRHSMDAAVFSQQQV